MDDLNPADFTVLQPYLDPVRVKRRLREQFLDDAAGQFSCALVLFEDNGNVCSPHHVTAVPSIHETYPLLPPRQNFLRATYHNNPWGQQNHTGLEGVQGDAGVCPLRPQSCCLVRYLVPYRCARRFGLRWQRLPLSACGSSSNRRYDGGVSIFQSGRCCHRTPKAGFARAGSPARYGPEASFLPRKREQAPAVHIDSTLTAPCSEGDQVGWSLDANLGSPEVNSPLQS